jgi:DNA-directed RNA polymerase specialized sigma24 family protein
MLPILADPGSGDVLGVVTLHDTLEDPAALDPRQAEIVELRYFGGLTEQQGAGARGLSPATIRREVATAEFWPGRRLRTRP